MTNFNGKVPSIELNQSTGSTEDTTSINSLFHSSEAFFSISLRPLLLEEIPGNIRTGCLVTTRVNDGGDISKDDEINNIRDRIRMTWRRLLTTCQKSTDDSSNGKTRLLQDVKCLLSSRSDDSLEILEACKKLSAATSVIAGADEADWLFPRSSLRKYAFLRRLAMPMHHVVVQGSSTTAVIGTLDVSLLNLLLDLPDLKDLVAQLLNQRLGEIEEEIDGKIVPSGLHARHLRQLQRMLSAALQRAGCSIRPDAYTKDEAAHDTYAIPERILKDEGVQKVRHECERLLRDLEERKKNPEAEICHFTLGGETKIPDRIRDGSLLVTEEELSCEEFVRQKSIMEMVNKKLKRPFYPGTSRARMHKAGLSAEAVSKLKSIFFDERGRLRKSIASDIDKSSRHGYITFSNSICQDIRNDYRWQVPLRRHDGHHFVSTRSMVESLLSEHGLIHPEHERIHDLGILIGGTEDQSIHHDIPRQTTSWYPQDPKMADDDDDAPFVAIPVGGWEYDRAAYNEAMASPYAPCSVLIGMGGSGKISVGVQKNQIDRRGCSYGYCRIVEGKEDEQYRIVRENQHLVVLEAAPGVMFTGDFQHAGVRNFPEGSPEDKIMVEFFERVESIAENAFEEDADVEDRTMDMISMMCNFDDLHKICRFHCSTEPIRGPLCIPRNTIGFVDCLPNPPTEEAVGTPDNDADKTFPKDSTSNSTDHVCL